MAGDATAFEGEDYQKLLSTKKKRKWKYIGLFAASLAAAGIGAYVLYRRAKMAQSLATQAVQELQPLKDQAADMNKWAAERYAEKQEELLNRAGNLHGESQPIVDMDGDGKADYYDADGDGNWDDNDLDNDGIRDYNPDTLVKEDIDAPENDYAYARAVVEDLGYTSDPNANLYYAGWKEAYTQLEIAEDLQSYVGTELNGLVSGLNRLEHDMGDILTQVLEKESVLGSHLANSTLYNFLTAGVGLVETGVTGAAYHGKWLAGRKTMPYLLDKVGGLEIKRVK